MKIEHKFDYECEEEELAEEFCKHDSEYQADVLNSIGHCFKRWTEDKTKTATYVQILEIAEMLDDDGKWFIKTLAEYAECGKMRRCKDCKYFEYDSVAKVDGVPLIVAHEICSRWGNGCKTREDGYCFLFEPQAEGGKKGE